MTDQNIGLEGLNMRYPLFLALFIGTLPNGLFADDEPQNASADKPGACLIVDTITGYRIENDQQIRFQLTGGSETLMVLKPHCPQLHFHDYFSYTPVNGALCAGRDEIKTRAGLPCRIDAIKPVSAENTIPPTP